MVSPYLLLSIRGIISVAQLQSQNSLFQSRAVVELHPDTVSSSDRFFVFYLLLTAAFTQCISYQWAAPSALPVTVICR